VRPLAASELVGLDRYAALRDAYRRRVVEYKRARRLAVGPSVSLVFEDRETLRFQVQEMIFVERIAKPAQVQHELDVYNELMPGPRALSATLFIEITEAGRIRAELDRLLGLDAHVWLVLGEGRDERRVRASFDRRQLEEDRLSAVHYLRFALSDADAARLADLRVRACLRIDHPHYEAEAELPGAVRASLVATLAKEPPNLLAESTAD
jgi:hypothetical protein